MAKVSMIQRELKRKNLSIKYQSKRSEYKKVILDSSSSSEEKSKARIKLQKLPVNSSKVRLQSRCRITGRPHAVYRRFGLCRNQLRRYAMSGDVPGLRKASW